MLWVSRFAKESNKEEIDSREIGHFSGLEEKRNRKRETFNGWDLDLCKKILSKIR
jgi:hypothetical protein